MRPKRPTAYRASRVQSHRRYSAPLSQNRDETTQLNLPLFTHPEHCVCHHCILKMNMCDLLLQFQNIFPYAPIPTTQLLRAVERHFPNDTVAAFRARHHENGVFTKFPMYRSKELAEIVKVVFTFVKTRQ